MRIPEQAYGSAGRGSANVPERATIDGSDKRILFFSRSRADLGLTLWIAAALVLCTMVLFQLDDGDVQLMTYNRHMREATCTVNDAGLENMEVPTEGAPPDLNLPGEDKWRGVLDVTVLPDDGSEPFNSTAHSTLTGKWSDERAFEQQFIINHPVGSSQTCYFGPADGRIGVVFNLMAALSHDTQGNILGVKGSKKFGLHVAKIVVAFFALLFTGLVIVKLVAGTWDDPPDEEAQYRGSKGEESQSFLRHGGYAGGGRLHDLQADDRGDGARSLDLRGGTPREFDEVPLGGGPR